MAWQNRPRTAIQARRPDTGRIASLILLIAGLFVVAASIASPLDADGEVNLLLSDYRFLTFISAGWQGTFLSFHGTTFHNSGWLYLSAM